MSDEGIRIICDTVMYLAFLGFSMWFLVMLFGNGKD